MLENKYPHLFAPLQIRGVTLKNRLEYAPTVVLKCNADGTMSQDMLDFMEWQAKTGAGLLWAIRPLRTTIHHIGSAK